MVLAINDRHHYAREHIAGICRYAAEVGNWCLVHHRGLAVDAASARSGLTWRPDGIICMPESTGVLAALDRLGAPVAVLGESPSPRPLVVAVDEGFVGRLAVEHLIARGYRQVVLAVPPRHRGHARFLAVQDAARARGIAVSERAIPWLDPQRDPIAQVAGFAAHLKACDEPTGVFCFNDSHAVTVAAACHRSGISLPGAVGILGVDDDPLNVFLGPVPLSSVAMPHREMGFQAAALLDQAMSGMATAQEPLRLPPTEVVARASTDLSRLADALVVAATAWIAAHLHEVIGVDQAAAAVGTHRRTLERRFRIALHHSVLDEIHRMRLDRARDRLRAGDQVAEAAAAAGCSAGGLTDLFREHHGVAPGRWRDQVLAGRHVPQDQMVK